MQETLQARLDRLEPATREVANVASVIGATFGLPLLERLTDPAGCRARSPSCSGLDLVVEERRRPVREYRFRHGLVQEVAYGSLTRRDGGAPPRCRRGARSARARRARGGLRAARAPLREAGEAEKAAEYLLAAGDAAWALYADRAALAHYRRALEFMGPTIPARATSLQDRARPPPRLRLRGRGRSVGSRRLKSYEASALSHHRAPGRGPAPGLRAVLPGYS